jgi:hypothetical protein
MNHLYLSWLFNHSRLLSLNPLGMLIMMKETPYAMANLRQVMKLPALIWNVNFQRRPTR